MVNVTLLHAAMRDRQVSVDQAAEALGMDRSTFYRRINRTGAKFTVEDVSKLSALLKLSAQALQQIFFSEQLA